MYTPSILVDAVIDALIAFLQPFVGEDTPIVRGQQNRVPPPGPVFVKLTEVVQSNLSAPAFFNSTDPAVQQATIDTSTRIDVQIDFYGTAAGDWARAVAAVWRSPYSPDQFPTGVAPLYCSEPHQSPLITGEEQYEFRWVITASLEYNPVVTVPQQSATQLKVNTFEDLP